MGKRRQDKHFEFGSFHVDSHERLLLRGGQPVPLSPKAFEILLVLLERSGQLIEKDDLMKAVWPDTFVEEGNLAVHVALLRKALGETVGESYIETVPRRGYRFTAQVKRVGRNTLIVRRKTRSRIVATTIEQGIPESTTSDKSAPSSAQLHVENSQTNRLSSTWKVPRYALVTGLLAVVLTLVGLGYFLTNGRFTRAPKAPAVKSIAVLPFKTIAADNTSELHGLGLTDILITRLSNIKDLTVRPTSAVMRFVGREQDTVSIGQQLQVDAVLEGTIYRAEDRVRVTARLVRISDRSTIWAGQFEKSQQDELRLQDEVAMQVIDGLVLQLSSNEKEALTKRYTDSADAYQLYVQGRYHWNKRTLAGMAEAERLFRNALDKDPNFGLAYVGLSDTLAMSYRSAESYYSVKKALELDPSLAEGYATLGFLNTFHYWEWQAAEDAFKRSIELNAGYATAHHWYAILSAIQGKTAQAKVEMHRALEINPLSHNFLTDLGQVHYFAGEYGQAEEYYRKAFEIYPDFAFAHQNLFELYLRRGEYEKAIEEQLKLEELTELFTFQRDADRQYYLRALADKRENYRRGGFRVFVDSLLNTKDTNPNMHYGRARFKTLLGDKQSALDDLEKAFETKAFLMPYVKVDPLLDGLRGEERYREIIRKMNL